MTSLRVTMSALVREYPPEYRPPQHCRHPSLATLRRPAPPARRDLGRAGRQFRAVLRQRDQGRALPVRRRRRTRDRAHRAAGVHRRGLARLSARCAPGHDLRLSRPWPLRAGRRPSLQSEQAAARSLRQAAGRPAAVESRAVRLPGRNGRRPDLRRARQRPVQLQGPRHRPRLHLGARPRRRTAWEDTVIYEAHVRGFTKRHPAVPEALRGTYAGVASAEITDYLRRSASRPSSCCRSTPSSTTATCSTRA